MKKLGLVIFFLVAVSSNAWGVGHWVDVTTAKTGQYPGAPQYMWWCPIVADSSMKATRLRVSIGSLSSPTEIRLGLYRQNGTKLSEGSAVVTASGYVEIAIPKVALTQGSTYYIAGQAASSALYFNYQQASGGFDYLSIRLSEYAYSMGRTLAIVCLSLACPALISLEWGQPDYRVLVVIGLTSLLLYAIPVWFLEFKSSETRILWHSIAPKLTIKTPIN
jgi:hypothetical protein